MVNSNAAKKRHMIGFYEKFISLWSLIGLNGVSAYNVWRLFKIMWLPL